MIIRFNKLRLDAQAPTKGSNAASGWDVRFNALLGSNGIMFEEPILEEDLHLGEYILHPGSRALFGTGIRAQATTSTGDMAELQLRSRSGLAWKKGLMVVNGIGTIDYDYTGELGVILYNASKQHINIKVGERIAQIVPMAIESSDITEEDLLPIIEETDGPRRGDGGYGHTGDL